MPDPTFTYDLYLSHAPADQAWVQNWLLPRLRGAGLTVATDLNFDIGVPRLENIERVIAASRHTLIIFTPAWLASEWAEFEALLVGTADPAARQRRLLPLLLANCDRPRRIAALTYADFRDHNAHETALLRLIDTIRGRTERDTLYAKAEHLLHARQFQDALATWHAVLELDPQYVDYLHIEQRAKRARRIRQLSIAGGVVAAFVILIALLRPVEVLPPVTPPQKTPTPSVSAAPTATSTPTATPTRTDTPSSTPVPMPQGHNLYDDFTAADALEANWRVDTRPQGKLCQLRLGEGKLYFNCVNPNPNADVSVTLPPIMQNASLAGLAVAVKVEKGGAFQLATNWRCTTGGSERAYQISMDHDTPIMVTEYHPPDLSSSALLGKRTVSPTQPHTLQIERSDSGLAFLIDSQPISLTRTPDFPPCLEMNDWSLEFFVRRDSTIQGWIDWVSTRKPSGALPPTTETVLFEDNFETSASQWTTSGNETWERRKDQRNPANTIYCIKSRDSHNLTMVGPSEWRDYALQFDMQVLQYGKEQNDKDRYGGLVSVHTIFAPKSQFYDYLFANNWAALTRYTQTSQSSSPQFDTSQLGITRKTTTLEQWLTMRIEARESGFKVFQDGNLVMLVSDPYPLAQGGIRLGATPDAEVCFDNVKVTALPPGN